MNAKQKVKLLNAISIVQLKKRYTTCLEHTGKSRNEFRICSEYQSCPFYPAKGGVNVEVFMVEVVPVVYLLKVVTLLDLGLPQRRHAHLNCLFDM